MPDSRLIYHFTHLENLPQIFNDGVLLADSLVHGSGKLKVEVGDLDVKSRRRSMTVTCPPGGCPANYVPFYFAPRSPMLYVIEKGKVVQYKDGQKSLVYLVSDVDRVICSKLQWIFTDGNCASSLTEYFNDVSALNDAVDWSLMKAKYWNDTAEDPDRMRRRMAELLVYERFPLELLVGVGTMTDTMQDSVKRLLERSGRSTYVATRRDWYF